MQQGPPAFNNLPLEHRLHINAMMEKVFFIPEASVRDKVAAAFATHRHWLRELFPEAEIEHVGSTAVPGALTKGDLDILVLITAEAFPRADALLAGRLERNAPSWRSETFSSFKDDEADPPLGVQLAVRGGESESFLRFRDLLISRPAALADYNVLKLLFEGGDMDEYRERKGEFIERLLATLRNQPVRSCTEPSRRDGA